MLRTLSTCALLALVAESVAGCRPPTASAPAQTVVLPTLSRPAASAAAAAPLAMVWTEGPEKERRTWTVDSAGTVVAQSDGVRVAVAGRIWQWKETGTVVRTRACEPLDDKRKTAPTPAPPPGKGVRATLEPLGGGVADEVVASVGSESGWEEVEQRVVLVATVGPYAFVRTELYAYACGVHGSTVDGYRVWDMARRAVAWDSTSPSSPEWTASSREAEKEALAEFGTMPDVAPFADEAGHVAMALTEIVPSFDAGARLRVAFQFTAPSCYACSDRLWSSYSKSMRKPVPSVPEPLRAWEQPPAGVRTFAIAHAELHVGGWSAL
jgi:hypothetical protein